jgi:hypothetical protein
MKKKILTIRKLELLFFLSLFIFSTTVTLKQHQGRGILSWGSEIIADMAGYYIYLPATFFYHFDVSKAPPGIDEKTGYSFCLDHEHNKITTQYFYGVSLLVSPFFFTAHAISLLSGTDEVGGFSWVYNKAFEVASVFYLVLGLFFLKQFLKNYFKESLQYIVVLTTFLGTNLFFYSIEITLMSHVYSFFTISVFLYAMKEFLKDTSRYWYFLLMAVAYGIMFILRPTNCLIGLLFPLWDAMNRKEVINRVKLILHPKYIFPLIAIMMVMFIPQMIYWKIMRGTFIYLKYGESFSFWNHPKFLQVWFSTLNGLVPWSPVTLFFIIGIVFMVIKKYKNGILILLFFLLVSYMAAAYKFWYYGCGYGHRAFVEFLPVFCIPFGFLAGKILETRRKIVQHLFLVILIFLCWFNARLSLVADKCNFGATWDWDYYVNQISLIYRLPYSKLPYTFRNDFENSAIYFGTKVTDSVQNSGTYSAVLDKDNEICCKHSNMVWDFNGIYPRFIQVQLLVKLVKPGPVNAYLVCNFEKNGMVYYIQSQPLEPFVGISRSWCKVFRTLRIPEGLPGDTEMNFYVWNKDKTTFFVDDLTIRYE